MKLNDLKKKHSYGDDHAVVFHWGAQKNNAVELAGISSALKSGTLKMSQWAKLSQEDLATVLIDMHESERETAAKNIAQVYDQWVDVYLRYVLMKDLNDVIKYAPHKTVEVATEILNAFDNLYTKPDSYFSRFGLNFSLEKDVDYKALVQVVEAPEYICDYQINSNEAYYQAEGLSRYRQLLEKIVTEGIEQDEVIEIPDERFSLPGLWPELVRLSNEIIVTYKSQNRHYKEYAYVIYNVQSVGGSSSSWALKNQFQQLFSNGFDQLIGELKSMPEETQKDILNGIYNEVEELKYKISDGEYTDEENEFGPEKTYSYKRFDSLVYKGDKDLIFAKNKSSRDYLDKEISEYTEGWLEGVDGILRKIEHAVNNLDLLKHSPDRPKFNSEEIFKDVFVIEPLNSGLQGSAFYLRDYGIVTCDHCIRDENGQLYSNLQIYRGKDLTKKIECEVVESDPDYDIAILKPVNGYQDFFSDGLEIGSSENLKRLMPIAVAGFPNYNYGDEGYLRTGEITGKRMIKSIPHVMVSASLVGGNSGGPVLNMDGQVIGIVVIGSESFSASDTTEKHGFLPINLINYFIPQD